jgi:hypothetical protein
MATMGSFPESKYNHSLPCEINSEVYRVVEAKTKTDLQVFNGDVNSMGKECHNMDFTVSTIPLMV